MHDLQAQLLQQLATSGIPDSKASLAHISVLPQQTVTSSNEFLHLVQPSTNISVSSQQQPLVLLSDENTSVEQQAAHRDHSLSDMRFDSAGGHSSESFQMQTESDTQHTQMRVDVSQSPQLVSSVSELYSRTQPGHVNPPRLSASHNSTDESPVNSQPTANLQPLDHSRVIEQLQQQLLQSSGKLAENGCHAAAKSEQRWSSVGCKGEEGEVDSDELMQFMSYVCAII